jgi:SulP family sulfate permease
MTDATISQTPVLRRWLSADTIKAARSDVIAGFTVAAISLPQSMAYALIAGVDPRFGLYTAIVFTAVAAIFGSSRHLINGPTGAVSLVTFSALAFIEPDARLDAYEAMFLLALLIGAVQIVIAVARLGDLTRYISESVIIGFISGAAVLTIVGQVASAVGVKAQGTGHQHVLERLYLTLTQPGPFNWKAIAISGAAIVLAILSKKLVRRFKLPQLDTLFVLIIVTYGAYLAGWTLAGPGVKPAISLIEAVPPYLPTAHVPQIKTEWLLDLSPSAVSIGILGLLEALSIAKAIAHQSGHHFDYNRQCLAEGIGNLVGGFFRCMPGAGSLSRTAINYQAGAVTRFSGVVTAIVVALVVLVFAPLTAYVPKAALAGLLIVAASRLIDVKRIIYTLRGSRFDATLAIVTAFAALAIGVEYAVLIGVAVSLVWYVPRASKFKSRELVVTPERVVRARIPSDPPSQGVLIYDFEGELFFGAAPDLEHDLEEAANNASAQGIKYLVLRLKRVRNPDVVALEVLDKFLISARKKGLTVLIAGVRAELIAALKRVGILRNHPLDLIFEEELVDFSATLKAIRRAYALAARESQAQNLVAADSLRKVEVAYYLV